MGVCIHILCFDAMGREIAKYGDPRGTQHLYIYRQDCHYHPVYKVHRLSASGDARPTASNWCDFCSKLVGANLRDGSAHIQKCALRATEDAATTLERVFLSKWHAKHQATFRYPGRGKPRQGKFCFVCNWFVEEADILETCEGEDELEEAEEDTNADLGQSDVFLRNVLVRLSYSLEDARCPECELRLYTVYFVACTICQTKIP
jgi:hypothetical protein